MKHPLSGTATENTINQEVPHMKHIPSRDITGHCEGDCRNLVREGEENRQRKINGHAYSGGSSPSVPWANSRNEQPGFLGGHV
jgi:hypothetical protein